MKRSEDVGGRHGREGEQSKAKNHIYKETQRKASWTHYGMKTSEDVGGRHGREGEQSKVRNHIYKETKESQLDTLWNEEIRRCGW